MPAVFYRFKANKIAFTLFVFILCYLLLRAIAFFKHETFTLPGEYFTFNDKQFRYLCQGQGAPYVFFETGFAADSEETWSAIIKKLPNTYTACYYDRLGHGGSDDVPTTFTTEQKSQLQEALITHIAANNPVVLVAHSYGGIISRRTVARANLNLSALILLDSAHENQHEVMRGRFDPIPDYVMYFQYLNGALGLADIKNIFTTYDSPMAKRLNQYYGSLRYAHVLSTYRNEKGFYTPLESLNYDFGDLNMLVLSHDKNAYAEHPRFMTMVDDWAQMQKSLAKLSNNAQHKIVKGATHNIPGDAPEQVVAQITSTVELVSTSPKAHAL